MQEIDRSLIFMLHILQSNSPHQFTTFIYKNNNNFAF